MQKRIIRPGMLGGLSSLAARPGRRPGGRRPGGRRPGAARPRPAAKIPTKMAELGFKTMRPGTGLQPPQMQAQKSLKGLYEKAMADRLANQYRNPAGRRPGGAGMGLGAMLNRLDRLPGGMSPGPMGRPTGMRPGGGIQAQDFKLTQAAGIAGRPVNSYAEADRIMAQRGGTGATGGRPPQTGGDPFAGAKKDMAKSQLLGGQKNLRGMFAEGGEVLKTPIDKLPNKGLKKLAKSPKGRKAVARMGFKEGGIAKGGKCPSRGTIRGTGAAIRGVGFKGIK